jgi:hypothetical protein
MTINCAADFQSLTWSNQGRCLLTLLSNSKECRVAQTAELHDSNPLAFVPDQFWFCGDFIKQCVDVVDVYHAYLLCHHQLGSGVDCRLLVHREKNG